MRYEIEKVRDDGRVYICTYCHQCDNIAPLPDGPMCANHYRHCGRDAVVSIRHFHGSGIYFACEEHKHKATEYIIRSHTLGG